MKQPTWRKQPTSTEQESTCEHCAMAGLDPLDCYRQARRNDAHRAARRTAYFINRLGA